MDASADPFDIPMVFLRIAWMDRYCGVTAVDVPIGGGSFVHEHGFGHEIFNFQPHDGSVFGYVQPPVRNDNWSEAKINLGRLGANENDRSIKGVLAVWVATSPDGGAFVVGWYRNAEVFREWQAPPSGSDRRFKDTDCGYFITAAADDMVLLPPVERVFSVPQQEKGGFGQSNIWYAADPDQNRDFRTKLIRFLETRQISTASLPDESNAPHQPDPFLRTKVERIAVESTVAHFSKLGYRVESVEKDNLGWDLQAAAGKRKLKLTRLRLRPTRRVWLWVNRKAPVDRRGLHAQPQ